MTAAKPTLVQTNPWDELRTHTSARIALGRVGSSLPTAEVLRFGLAHAQARDAVHHPLDVHMLSEQLQSKGFHTIHVHSQAADRQQYLLRPDHGRMLDIASREQLMAEAPAPDIAIVIADGLSSFAASSHAVPILELLKERFDTDWSQIPVVIAEQARVALGDEIGERLNAQLVIVMIGERPGLTSPDSLGLYVTYQPRRGRMDSERNCISNVRPEGLPYRLAVHKLDYLIKQALKLKLTGVNLKDDSVLPLLKSTPTA
ncbi:ethanolamine ammonia-lyase subunit EutC [Pseudomonas luteola]|uniref:ethanolamine ammonia-lyase subunit EutC n=1 Tax=Pseudomonas TaxID=286 RepID=UPI00388E5C1F